MIWAGGAHQVEQQAAGCGVACLTVEDVVEARLPQALITQMDEELQRVHDLPARVCVHVHESFILRGHLVGVAIPIQVTIVK